MLCTLTGSINYVSFQSEAQILDVNIFKVFDVSVMKKIQSVIILPLGTYT